MTNEEKYRYWEMISDYDMETVRAMIVAKRWLYVASICYSGVERLLKGLTIANTRKEAPKSDNLVFLMNRLSGNETFLQTDKGARFNTEKKKYFDLIADVTFYHINDYPFSYQKVADRFIDEKTAMEVYEKACRIISWLKTFAPAEEAAASFDA